MIYEYDYIGPLLKYLSVMSLFPSYSEAAAVGCLSIPLLILFWLNYNRWTLPHLDRLTLLIATVTALAVYLLSQGYVDEVYVNLEHPYNLFHHGMFSFSPHRMVDGTVEFFYYLLLTPFAFSQTSLILAASMLGFIILWLHLYLLWRLLPEKHPVFKLCAMLYFAINVSFIEIFSSGFGNGLVSLFLFICIYYRLTGRHEKSGWIATVMPLIRPDAILYSGAILFVNFIQKKRNVFAQAVIAFLMLGFYFKMVHFFYGHFIPTPMAFKSFKWAMMEMISLKDFLIGFLRGWLFDPFHSIFVLSWILCSFTKRKEKIYDLAICFFPLLIIFLFYLIILSTRIDYTLSARYAVGWELLTVLFPIWLALAFSKEQSAAFRQRWAGYFSPPQKPIIFFITLYFLLLGNLVPADPPDKIVTRTDYLAFAGQVADKIIPKDWSVGTTEVNTFGFMNDLEILDLYGYTNPQIAHSKSCNNSGIRHNPKLLMDIKPPAVWLFNVAESGSFYEGVMIRHGFQKQDNQGGDMEKVLEDYDLFVLKPYEHGDIVVSFLIHKNMSEEFKHKLSKNEFSMQHTRSFDLKRFRKLYSQQQLKQYKCG